MERDKLLAAEIFGYSYANYHGHLGIGNVRFERLMPEVARTLQIASDGNWAVSRLASALKRSEEQAQELMATYRNALQVVDAESPAESFRNAVRFAIQDALQEGLGSPDSIEALVTQICYRAADLAYLLKMRGEALSRYSRHLRKEPGVEYYEGYFDEED